MTNGLEFLSKTINTNLVDVSIKIVWAVHVTRYTHIANHKMH